eukprot:GHVT01087093.1.p1 GENE.GHVT01087093.1~~GHVT01087093.1.p1  ORF type:complete len:476 (+),score=85.48 GHVT01087093.1:282-1709(+)
MAVRPVASSLRQAACRAFQMPSLPVWGASGACRVSDCKTGRPSPRLRLAVASLCSSRAAVVKSAHPVPLRTPGKPPTGLRTPFSPWAAMAAERAPGAAEGSRRGLRHVAAPRLPPPTRLWKKLNPRAIRLPNRKTKAKDFRIGLGRDGRYQLYPPYPPQINRTIPPCPPTEQYEGRQGSGRCYTHRHFRLAWGNVEYLYTPVPMPKPRGLTGFWGGELVRIEKPSRKPREGSNDLRLAGSSPRPRQVKTSLHHKNASEARSSPPKRTAAHGERRRLERDEAAKASDLRRRPCTRGENAHTEWWDVHDGQNPDGAEADAESARRWYYGAATRRIRHPDTRKQTTEYHADDHAVSTDNRKEHAQRGCEDGGRARTDGTPRVEVAVEADVAPTATAAGTAAAAVAPVTCMFAVSSTLSGGDPSVRGCVVGRRTTTAVASLKPIVAASRSVFISATRKRRLIRRQRTGQEEATASGATH